MIRASQPQVVPRGGARGGWRASIRVRTGPGAPEEELWFEGPGGADEVDPSGTPWAVALAPLAFHRGVGLHVAAPVDRGVAEGLSAVTGIWSRWYGGAGPVPLTSSALTESGPRPGDCGRRDLRLAAFFSGGVDSMWTALEHRRSTATTRDLISVHGFDIPLSEVAAFDAMADRFAHWSARWGGRLVALRTNYRVVSTGGVPWGELAHGCALVAGGLLLGPRYDVLRVAATGGVRDPHPWGSHLETDALLGTRSTRVEHHGAEAARWEKVRAIAGDDEALALLRVCWRTGTDRNCGRCSKCLRTMALLELFGVLERAPTFPDRLSLDELARVHVAESWDVREFSDLEEQGALRGRPDLVRAARLALRRTRRRARALRVLSRFAATPGLRTAVRNARARIRSGWIP